MEKEKQQMMREQRLEYWEPASKAEASVSEGPDGGERGEAEERPLKSRSIQTFVCSGASLRSSVIWGQSCPLIFQFLNRSGGGCGSPQSDIWGGACCASAVLSNRRDFRSEQSYDPTRLR